jgi:hypothetical protein
MTADGKKDGRGVLIMSDALEIGHWKDGNKKVG